jgi:hypothetical protein
MQYPSYRGIQERKLCDIPQYIYDKEGPHEYLIKHDGNNSRYFNDFHGKKWLVDDNNKPADPGHIAVQGLRKTGLVDTLLADIDKRHADPPFRFYPPKDAWMYQEDGEMKPQAELDRILAETEAARTAAVPPETKPSSTGQDTEMGEGNTDDAN